MTFEQALSVPRVRFSRSPLVATIEIGFMVPGERRARLIFSAATTHLPRPRAEELRNLVQSYAEEHDIECRLEIVPNRNWD